MNLFAPLRRSAAPRDAGRAALTPRPERSLYVIGDVHGCHDALSALLTKIDADIERRSVTDPQVVMLGDMVDYGPDSAGVLALVQNLARDLPGHVVCLKGQHESQMLDFLDDPTGAGRDWIGEGGLMTLRSFGIGGGFANHTPDALAARARDLRAALPDGLETWLRGLPHWWESGNVLCIHAAADRDRAPWEQPAHTVLQGSPGVGGPPPLDGRFVVHGHITVDRPERQPGRVAVDTGCYWTGRLTAAALSPTGEVRFLQADS